MTTEATTHTNGTGNSLDRAISANPNEEGAVTLNRKLGPMQTFLLAEIDPDQSRNPRSVITKQQRIDRAQGLRSGGGSDAPLILFAYEKPTKEGYKYWIISGNITYFAASDLKWPEIEGRLFLGSEMEADFRATIANESHQPTSSYDKARDLIGKKEKWKIKESTRLAEMLKTAGWNISNTQIDNLIGAYKGCLPEAVEVWKYVSANVPIEERPKVCFLADGEPLACTDQFVFWFKGVPKDAQPKIWNRIKAGEAWQSIKAELKSPAGIAPKAPVTFYGRPFQPRKPDEYIARTGEILLRLREAKLPKGTPTQVIVETTVKAVLGDLPVMHFVLEIERRMEALDKSSVGVAKTVKAIATKSPPKKSPAPNATRKKSVPKKPARAKA